jgi:NhaA family Na+:H+ antiporter
VSHLGVLGDPLAEPPSDGGPGRRPAIAARDAEAHLVACAGMDGLWLRGPTWSASDRTLARRVGRPLAAFLRIEAAGGLVLFLAAAAAMAWANSPGAGAYTRLWGTEVGFSFGDASLSGDLRHWVNSGLMSIFFLVAGLEIKLEMVVGNLRNPRAVALPVIAAIGGMAVPALIFLAVAPDGVAARGWGVPMATDIAFAVGLLAVLGSRVPVAARLFLLTLAIVDDVGSVLVIAVFYPTELSTGWLAVAGSALAAVVLLRHLRVWAFPAYVVLGVVAWFATDQSGVHATMAGVAMGLLAPARPLLDIPKVRRHLGDRALLSPDAEMPRLGFLLRESTSVASRLLQSLHPWSSFLVLPIFALANAGLHLSPSTLAAASSSRLTWAVFVALVFGKFLGVSVASWAAVRLGWGQLPPGTTWSMMAGLAVTAGVGFTVSLFVAGLAYDGSPLLAEQAKIGVLAASVTAGVVGLLMLRWTTRRPSAVARPAAGA